MKISFLLSLLLPAIGAVGFPPVEDAEPRGAWLPYSQREALRPEYRQDAEVATLTLASSGSFHTNGAWRRQYKVTENRFYRFDVEYLPVEVGLMRRSVLVKIDWLGADGSRVGYPDYPSERGRDEAGWQRLGEVLQAPKGATTAQIDLILRWDTRGRVHWRNVRLESAPAPAPRKARLATVNHRPRDSAGPMNNLEEFSQFVEEASKEGADIVCLPEGATLVGTGKAYLEVAETVPGPSTKFLGTLARRFNVNIVAGLIEQDGETAYNTAVLLGRSGALVGKYRKVSLPREEIEGGLTPGSDFPVFDLDFGRVGILICWDIQFPEGARRLADRGAEVILLPIWGGTEPLYPARALENQVYLVSSSFDSITGIWGPKGDLLTEAADEGSIAIAEVDLAARIHFEWVGDLRSRIPRESPPVSEATD